MGLFIIDLQTTVNYWPPLGGTLDNVATFIRLPHAERVMIDLLGVAIASSTPSSPVTEATSRAIR